MDRRPNPRFSRAGAETRVTIIGAGFSGTMAAVHLRRALGPMDGARAAICLFDRSGRFARGPAYANNRAPHLLNVRARNMSAFPDEPDHFDHWLAEAAPGEVTQEVARTEAGHFATRRLYGRYLRQLLYRELTEAGGGVRLAAADIAALERADGAWVLRRADGRRVRAAAVVLASGNLARPDQPDGAVFHNPWADTATTGLRPGAPVLVVGTGLTMVDIALDMRGQGFDGPIHAISRRGLIPHRHGPVAPPWPAPDFTPGERGSVPGLLRRLRLEAARAAASGVDWRATIDGLRPVTATLWRDLPETERARFLRHARPFWDVHRHRMAPPVANALAGLLADGGLTVLRGRVRGAAPAEDGATVTLDLRGGRTETRVYQRVIHATGLRLPGETDAVIAGLCRAGLARLDEQRLGLCVDADLRVIGADGEAAPNLWALGPIVRGMTWESTAVPDIRVQAQRLAEAVGAALTAG